MIKRMRTRLCRWIQRLRKIDTDQLKINLRRRLIGMRFTDGLIFKIGIYTLLISLSYIYLYPLLFMITNSFMTVSDIISVSIRWIPSTLNWENYRIVWERIGGANPDVPGAYFGYPKALRDAIVLAAVPALSATVSSALIGYGFAKYNFPFKKLLMILMIMTFIIPPQITMLPIFMMYSRYELLGTMRTFIYPAILGQGLNAAIFILIFYSFFRMIPKSLEESAQLDGAGPFTVFVRIALPLAIPAIIIVFLFSFVWYYNETYLSGLFLRDSNMLPLPLRVEQFFVNYTAMFPEGSPARQLMQAVRLAGNILTILPLLILYFFTQRYFVESIDKTGITGE